MRSMTTIAAALLIGAPIVATGTPARADNNDLMGQAQRFLNGNSGNDRDAYQRGRDDEMRRQQAERDRERIRRDYDGTRAATVAIGNLITSIGITTDSVCQILGVRGLVPSG